MLHVVENDLQGQGHGSILLGFRDDELGAQVQAGDGRNTNNLGSVRATWKNQARCP
jgi:hypothetical protein